MLLSSKSFFLSSKAVGAKENCNLRVHQQKSRYKILPIRIARRTLEMVAIHVAVLRTLTVLDILVTFSGAGKYTSVYWSRRLANF